MKGWLKTQNISSYFRCCMCLYLFIFVFYHDFYSDYSDHPKIISRPVHAHSFSEHSIWRPNTGKLLLVFDFYLLVWLLKLHSHDSNVSKQIWLFFIVELHITSMPMICRKSAKPTEKQKQATNLHKSSIYCRHFFPFINQ